MRGHIVFAIAVAAGAAALMATLWTVRDVLVLVYVCALLAVGLRPLVRWIESRDVLVVRGRRPPRWLVILVLYALGLGVVSGAGLVVVPPLVAQGQDLFTRGPELLQRAQSFLDAHGAGSVRLASLLPSRMSRDVLGTVLGTVTGILGVFLTFLTVVILSFYFLVEGDQINAFWLRLLPRRHRSRARVLGARVMRKVSAWLAGQMILCVGIGSVTAVVLALLGVPYSYVLAILAGIGELIPYAGPFVAGVTATAIATLTVSWHIGLATAGYFLAQQLLENNVVQPQLMSEQIGVSATTVIVAVLLGGALLGITGAVLAVPTAAILEVTIRELTAERR